MVQLTEQDTLSENGLLLIARFLWCLPVLCPTFKQCLVSLYQQVDNFKVILFCLLNFDYILPNKY